MSISVTDPIGQAISRATLMTFKPFNLGRWFIIGFVAWLASLDRGGGLNINMRTSGTWMRPAVPPATPPWPATTSAPSSMPDAPDEIWNWIAAHALVSVLIGAGIALAVLAFTLLILWLSSRGKFVFYEAIATNTATVVVPWKQYRALANSLFGFRLALMLAGFVAVIVLGGISLKIAWPDIQARQFGPPASLGLVIGLVLLVPILIGLAIINWCTTDFIIPIMYAGKIKVLPAWQEFREVIVPGHIGSLMLFLLMRIVLTIAVGLMTIIVGCATCCIGFLPYIGTVVTLPLSIFQYSYPIYFMQQFGPRYVVIQEPQPPPPPSAFPVIMNPPPL